MRRLALAALVVSSLTAAPAFGDSSSPGTTTTPTTTTPTTTTPTPTPSKPKPMLITLSNETTSTSWAYTNLTLKVRKDHSPRARVLTKLHFNTEDHYPEIYLALAEYTDGQNIDWVKIRIPGRPNGRTGWVPREGLGEFHVTHDQLVVNRRTLKATLFRKGRKIFQAPVGVGKASTPTPAGHFWIRERLTWSARFGDVYGPLAFGTADYSRLSDWPGGGVVGVHGTNEPALVPGRPSHGCIRMHNKDIVRLGRLMKPGTPLLVV